MTLETGKVRVRFAPSPTGFVHIGSLRTALYDYLFARKNGGDFIVRLEDTDRTRFVPGAAENLIQVLDKMGLGYDEGPALKSNFQFSIFNFQKNTDAKVSMTDSMEYPGLVEVGEYGPYIQSERLNIYKKYADELLASGKAYHCFCTTERLEKMREEQMAAKQAPKYDRHCLSLNEREVQEKLTASESHVIRLKVPDDKEISFNDLVRGTVQFKTNTIDDQVLMKSDGFPTYHLAVVVDDHLMNITHIIRGEEWLPSTPKHVLLYRAFGWETPTFAHMTLLLNPDRTKLSKRQGDVAVEDYLKKGYLKEALINFAALLGWNPGEGSTQEIFSLDELVEQFDFSHVHKAGAIFDLKKLDWLNAQYIKKLSLDELYVQSIPFWKAKAFYNAAPAKKREAPFIKNILTIEQERLTRLDEVGEQNQFFFALPEYDRELLRWKQNDDATTYDSLKKALEILQTTPIGQWSRETLQEILLEAAGDKRGDFLWPLRVALTGSKYSPSPSDVAWVLGKDEAVERVSTALEKRKGV